MSAREALLAAARELLWEQGYEAMSPRAILDRSGVGQGSLYHHFTCKQDLARASLEETSAEFCARLDEDFDRDLPPLERVRRWLKTPRQALKGCRMGRMAAELAIHEAAIRRPVGQYFARLEQLLAASLEAAIEAGDLPRHLDARDLAAALAAMVQGGYVLARTRDDAGQMRRATNGALALLEAAARGAHGGQPKRKGSRS